MSVFPEWEKYAVPQRRQLSGCIPTGYEMLLRAAEVPDIDFDTFQDEFDLDSFCPKKGLSGVWKRRMAGHSFT